MLNSINDFVLLIAHFLLSYNFVKVVEVFGLEINCFAYSDHWLKVQATL